MTKELSTDEMQRIAEGIVGTVRWVAPGVGYCRCPGVGLHNNTNGKRDCRVSVAPGRAGDGTWVEAPTITCFHSSCSEVVAAANHRLRSEIGKAKTRLEPGRRRSQGAPPMTQGPAARTSRTQLFDIKPASERSRPESRTLRTGFLPSYALREIVADSSYAEDVAGVVSEVSEPVSANDSLEKLSEASEPALLQLVRTAEPIARNLRHGYATWVTRNGAAFACERQGDELRIGRQIARAIPEERQ